jgi:hypothetical protein
MKNKNGKNKSPICYGELQPTHTTAPVPLDFSVMIFVCCDATLQQHIMTFYNYTLPP